MYNEIYQKILHAQENNTPVTLVTVVEIDRSTPTLLGSKMLVYPNGSIAGTIGGGEIEFNVIKQIVDNTPNTTHIREFKLIPSTGTTESLSMVCGGFMRVLIEPVLNPDHLFLIGAGHCSIALENIAKMADFSITVVDDRPLWANSEKHPNANNIMCIPYTELKNKLTITPNSYVVIMTHGHVNDEICVRELITSNAKYIGVIGSKTKTLSVFDRLKKIGITEDQLRKLYAPIGFNLGTKSPVEVAISILAQIIAVKNGITEVEFSSNPILK